MKLWNLITQGCREGMQGLEINAAQMPMNLMSLFFENSIIYFFDKTYSIFFFTSVMYRKYGVLRCWFLCLYTSLAKIGVSVCRTFNEVRMVFQSSKNPSTTSFMAIRYFAKVMKLMTWNLYTFFLTIWLVEIQTSRKSEKRNILQNDNDTEILLWWFISIQ